MSFALTSLSPESRLSVGLNELDCSASAFGKICDLPGTAISQALSGHTPLSNERGTLAMKVLGELRELVASTNGIPVSFANPSIIRKLLDEKRRMSRGIPQPTSFNVKIGNCFFVEKHEFFGVSTTIFMSTASRVSHAVADSIAAELLHLGYAEEALKGYASVGA
jgi:hypothetical protein